MAAAPVLPGDIAVALTDPKAYGEWHGLHDKLSWARANAPLAMAQVEGYDPFWAVTRHADIMEVSRNNKRFASAEKQTTLTMRAIDDLVRTQTPDGHLIRSLVQMDAPDHMKYRLLTQSWFMPKNLKTVEDRIREIARETVDHMLSFDGTCDFAKDVALHYPLRVVMNILGVPREDEPRMLLLTQQLFGPTDPELNRAKAQVDDPIEGLNMLKMVIADFENYFKGLTEDRRRNPKEDVATVLANATVYARLMGREDARLRQRLGTQIGPRTGGPAIDEELP